MSLALIHYARPTVARADIWVTGYYYFYYYLLLSLSPLASLVTNSWCYCYCCYTNCSTQSLDVIVLVALYDHPLDGWFVFSLIPFAAPRAKRARERASFIFSVLPSTTVEMPIQFECVCVWSTSQSIKIKGQLLSSAKVREKERERQGARRMRGKRKEKDMANTESKSRGRGQGLRKRDESEE